MTPLSTDQVRSVFRTFLGGDPADPSFGQAWDGFDLMMHVAASPEHERFVIGRHEARQRYCVTETPAGTFLTYGADKVIGESLRRAGRFEEGAIERVIAFSEQRGAPITRSVFVDVGANIGTHSLHALSIGFERAICVEADKDNFKALRINQILNDAEAACHNVHAAASAQNGEATMEASPSNFGDHRVKREGAEVAVHGEGSWLTHRVVSRRLDDIVEEAGVPPDGIGLVWIDTQGHEGQVLAGAPKLLDSRVPIVIEFWPYGLQRSGGLLDLKAALRRRRRIFDLRRSDADGAPVAVPAEAIDAMYEQMRRSETAQSSPHTDLLLL